MAACAELCTLNSGPGTGVRGGRETSFFLYTWYFTWTFKIMHIYPFLKRRQNLHVNKEKISNIMEDWRRIEWGNSQLSQYKWPVAPKKMLNCTQAGKCKSDNEEFLTDKNEKYWCYQVLMWVWRNGLSPSMMGVVIGLVFQKSNLSMFIHTYNANPLWSGRLYFQDI